jgi:hypothetical protein
MRHRGTIDIGNTAIEHRRAGSMAAPVDAIGVSGMNARELLAPIYSWFTDGFDTRDVNEAKALLDELTA